MLFVFRTQEVIIIVGSLVQVADSRVIYKSLSCNHGHVKRVMIASLY